MTAKLVQAITSPTSRDHSDSKENNNRRREGRHSDGNDTRADLTWVEVRDLREWIRHTASHSLPRCEAAGDDTA